MDSLTEKDRFRPPRIRRTDALISSKLRIPPLKSRMLPRTQLLRRLQKAKNCRIIVISSVAGSGKTTLACQWIKEGKFPVAWYSIDKTDNDFDTFFRYFLRALGNLDKTLLSTTKVWLEGEKSLLGSDFIAFVIQHFTTSVAEEIYLVIDDYHFITRGEIHDALFYFIEHMPENMHLVIISRYAIPFSLSRFRVRNQIMEILSQEINFTESETAQFFSEIMPVDLSEGQVKELTRYTEGWVGGLQLLALSLKAKSRLVGLSDIPNGISKEVIDYLVDEVISAQPSEIREFLCVTAVLDRFNADLCQEITGRRDVQATLEHLYNNNIFLISLDTERIWYRYHQLFSEAIRGVVAKELPHKVKEVHRTAALWFAQNHYLEDAFEHAFASQDIDFAADLMEDCWVSLYDRYDISFYLRWLANFPHQVLIQRPLLRLHACTLKMESLELSEIEAVVKDIESHQAQAFERYRGMKKTLCSDMLAYLKCVFPCYRDQVRTDTQQISETLFTNSPEDKFLCGIMKVTMARWYLIQGNLTLAAETLREASPLVLSSENLWGRLLWYKGTSDVERWQGHFHRAEAIAREGLLFLEERGLSHIPLKFMLYLPVAWVLYYGNDLKKAAEYGSIALKYAELTKAASFLIEASILLVFTYAAAGDTKKAAQCARRLYEVSGSTGNPNSIISVEACVAYPQIANAELEWLESRINRKRRLEDPPFSFTIAHENLVRAGLLYRQKRYWEAVDELQTFRRLCVSRNIMLPVMDIDLMHSATLYALKDYTQAKAIMEQALAFSEAEGYIRPFAAYAPMIAPVLEDMAQKQSNCKGPSHLLTIVKTCSIERYYTTATKGFRGNRIEELTPREIEILELMAAGYRNREIGEKAFISLDTVKTHIKHIFEKLNVKTRVQAIKKAEKLGLFADL